MNKNEFFIIDDNNPDNNWEVLACKENKCWIHLSAPIVSVINNEYTDKNQYDVSKIYEIDLITKERKELKLFDQIYILRRFYNTDNFLYFIVRLDENKDGKICINDCVDNCMRIYQMEQKTGSVTEIWKFEKQYISIFDVTIIDDIFFLFYLSYKHDSENIIGGFYILDILKQKIELIYEENDNLISPHIYMTKNQDTINIIKDLHIMPSDKRFSNSQQPPPKVGACEAPKRGFCY